MSLADKARAAGKLHRGGRWHDAEDSHTGEHSQGDEHSDAGQHPHGAAHVHGADHAHSGDHAHGAENPHAGQGPVLLNIGGEVGALVVWASPALDGAEIEICPAGNRDEQPDEGRGWWSGEWRGEGHEHDHGDEAAWPHVAVVKRPMLGGPRFAAVFPGLHEGRYELWLRPSHPTALTVAVTGGRVADVSWPTD